MLGKFISSAKGNVQPFGTLELVKAKIFYKEIKTQFKSVYYISSFLQRFSDRIDLLKTSCGNFLIQNSGVKSAVKMNQSIGNAFKLLLVGLQSSFTEVSRVSRSLLQFSCKSRNSRTRLEQKPGWTLRLACFANSSNRRKRQEVPNMP